MNSLASPPAPGVRRLLEQDRVWCAYALADLEPPLVEQTSWWMGEAAVAMVFHGLRPPLLFFHGDPSEVDELSGRLPPGAYQYGLLATHRSRLQPRLRPSSEVHMWRMVLRPEAFAQGGPADTERLQQEDLPALLELFDNHPDRPDSFDARQLEDGVFFGIRDGGRLVAAAGTHVVADGASVAAIGNVFTHPDHRGAGLARRASAAVVQTLIERKIATVVLNVAMDNDAALQLYRGLGFWPFCGYYEGIGTLTPSPG